MNPVDRLISEDLNLADTFTIPEFSLWREAAEAALKGGNFEHKLYTQTLEGIAYQPLYTADDLKTLPPESPNSGDGRRSPQKSWLIAQTYHETDPQRLSSALSLDRTQGLDRAEINLDQLSPDALKTTLQTHFDFPLQVHSASPEVLKKLQQALHAMGKELKDFKGHLLMDPLNAQVQGKVEEPDTLFGHLAELYQQAPESALLEVSGQVYHDAGAHAAQELACVISSLVESVEGLKQHGLNPHQILSQCRISLGSGVHFFMELAKFRAARILLQRICRAYDSEAQPQIHAQTSTLWLSLYDPYVNYLRQTVGTLAAVLGGADSVNTGCFNERSGQPDDFARRLARNVQLILKDEVHLDEITDPAGGAYFVESLTTQLAEAAWKIFQDIEGQGGILTALKTGSVQAAVKATAQERLQAVARRKQMLIGSTAYANPEERLTAAHILAPWPEPSPEEIQAKERALLQPIFLAAGFEALRQQAESKAISVLLLCLGSTQDWLARADFSRAFFQVAGLKVEQSPALKDVPEALEALAEQPAIIVLCTSDPAYENWLPELVPAIKQHSPQSQLVLAGRPREVEGIDQFIYLGCHALDSLEKLLQA